jgi:hypothetical protein
MKAGNCTYMKGKNHRYTKYSVGRKLTYADTVGADKCKCKNNMQKEECTQFL